MDPHEHEPPAPPLPRAEEDEELREGRAAEPGGEPTARKSSLLDRLRARLERAKERDRNVYPLY